MMFCGVPYLIGYLTLSYAHYAPTATAFKVLLLTGRFISGVGMGWASSVAPVSQCNYLKLAVYMLINVCTSTMDTHLL